MGEHESQERSFIAILRGAGAVRAATLTVRQFGGHHDLKSGDVARLEIMIEELVTNLFDHGGVTEDGDIELRLRRSDADVIVAIVDPGLPFDPRLSDATEVPPERGGGAGIALVRAWADIIDYRSTDGLNRLELRMMIAG